MSAYITMRIFDGAVQVPRILEEAFEPGHSIFYKIVYAPNED